MRVSVSSLAVETLSQEVMRLLRTLGVQQLTLAVEHGDEKVRKQLGKPFSDEDLINTLKAAEALGYRGVKLYFINGVTPDWRFNAESASKLLNDIRKAVKMSIKVSASVFVPKPGTAMKDEAFPSEQLIDMERKMLLATLLAFPLPLSLTGGSKGICYEPSKPGRFTHVCVNFK